MGAMPNKTDRNDARGIAQIMRTGWYRAVHVKSPSCRSWRALLTARRMVLNKRRDVENGIRALLREVGLKVGTPSRKDFPARVRELTADDPVLAGLAESLLGVVEVMTREVERLTKRVLDEVRIEPTCRRLMTVPGVGPLTGLAFRATIDQPDLRSTRPGAHAKPHREYDRRLSLPEQRHPRRICMTRYVPYRDIPSNESGPSASSPGFMTPHRAHARKPSRQETS
jgi:transposase